VGTTGHSTGSHLHYEVRIGSTPVNPYRFLARTNVVHSAAAASDFPF
jgi:murein DD-endopeptidase MepM/ murein hydrolase activator NlpD